MAADTLSCQTLPYGKNGEEAISFAAQITYRDCAKKGKRHHLMQLFTRVCEMRAMLQRALPKYVVVIITFYLV